MNCCQFRGYVLTQKVTLLPSLKPPSRFYSCGWADLLRVLFILETILFQVENYANCQTYFQWDSALLIYKDYFPVSTLTCHTGWWNGKTDMLQKKELSTLFPQPLHLTFKQLAFDQWDWIRFWTFFPLKPHTESISPLSSPPKTQTQPKKKKTTVLLNCKFLTAYCGQEINYIPWRKAYL